MTPTPLKIKGWKQEGLIYTRKEEQLALGKFRTPTITQVISRIEVAIGGSELSYFQDKVSLDGFGELVGSYLAARADSLEEFMPGWIKGRSHPHLLMEYPKQQVAVAVLMTENEEFYSPAIAAFLADYSKLQK